MYIISKHRDYYDGAVGMGGIDKSIVYKRDLIHTEKPKNIFKGTNYSFFNCRHYMSNSRNKNYHIFIIGFCGKLYVGYKFEWNNYDNYNLVRYSDTFYYNIDFEDIHKGIEFKNRISYNKIYKHNKEGLKEIVENIQSLDLTDVFREFNTPVFVFDTSLPTKRNFIINPELKEYMFARLFDPYTAFQEIGMYISGVLGTSNDGNDIEMDEKSKVQQHGFNKWSFRKPPK